MPSSISASGGGYACTEKESYLLSLRDLNASQQIDALLEAGVSSFKIEGRMKGQGYVRSVVSAYRSLIDSHDKSPKYRTDALHEAQRLLTESFNRSYQDDFLLDDVKKDTLTGATSGNLIPKTAQTDPGLERKIPIYGYVDVTETGNLRLACWDEAGHSVTVVSEYVPERAKIVQLHKNGHFINFPVWVARFFLTRCIFVG